MAFAWDPAKDSSTPTWTYSNSDRDVRHSGGNYPAFGTDDCEFDSDPSGDGIVFSITVVDVSSGSPNGNATFGFCDSTQADDDHIGDTGFTYTRSGVLYADGSFEDFGYPAINAGDEIVFGIKDNKVQWLVVGGVEQWGPDDTGFHVAFTNKTDFVPFCNPRLSSGTANWRLNTLAADIGETIPSGFEALESAGGGTDALTGDDLTAGTPSLDSPAITQEHDLTGDDVATAAPTLSSPTLSEIVALAADDVTAGTPALDTPAIGQEHAFTAVELETTPTVSQTAIGQTHIMAATDLATTPVLDSPALGQTHALAATNLTGSAPTLDSPALAQVNALTGNDLATQAPALDSPSLGQIHALLAGDVTSGTPILDTPVMGIVGGEHNLTADDVLTGTPVLGTPYLGGQGGIGGGSPAVHIGIRI